MPYKDPEKARANRAKRKEAIRERARQYRAEHPDQFRAYDRKRRERNADKIRARKRAYYLAGGKERGRKYREEHRDEVRGWYRESYQRNREKIRAKRATQRDELNAKAKAYRDANREKMRATWRAYAARNKDARDAISRKRYAIKYGVDAERVSKRAVFERDGWHCMICGRATPEARMGTKHANAPELDHRVPLSKGGAHTYANTQCACHACNLKKNNRSNVGQMPLWSRPAAPTAAQHIEE